MTSMFIFNETLTYGYRDEVLNIISLVSILAGILVIISKNPIVSVLFLIGLFISIAGYLIILGISFIGISYLLVYVGAVSILFLFILMLINVRISELLSDTSNGIPLALIIAISFNFPLYEIIPYGLTAFNNYIFNFYSIFKHFWLADNYHFLNKIFYTNDNEILYTSTKVWDTSLAEYPHITSIGNIMYTSYSIWLILTSIILLLAMIGAIIITIKQND